MDWLNGLATTILVLIVVLMLISWINTGSPTKWLAAKFTVAPAKS